MVYLSGRVADVPNIGVAGMEVKDFHPAPGRLRLGMAPGGSAAGSGRREKRVHGTRARAEQGS
jgi:hypothetical protein